jgi:hypothetical protein
MNEFTFQQPAAFLLILLLIPLGWLLHRARQKRRAVIQALGTTYSTHRRLRDILRLSALTLCVCALAKPGYDPETRSVSNTGRDIVFALDVSRSMLAEDVIPSRLEVAKQGIRDALDSFESERVGLVIYAGSSSILCPLTYDHDFVAHMLEQAHPRAVDFGGTTMQSAVEKVVDQVFLEGREDVQDIIILTDGGDHGSKMEKVTSLLEESKANALIVGIGNPNQGSPIPVLNDSGQKEDLSIDGQTIFTKLDDASLHAFAQQSTRAQYTPVATAPFDLGQLYREYASDKQKVATDDETGFTVYRDASLYFLAPALLLLLLAECWGLKGLQLGHAVAFTLLLTLSPADAANSYAESEFNAAKELMVAGKYEEASTKFAELYQQLSDTDSSNAMLAATSFNRGLCLHELSHNNFQESAETAQSYALQAQQAFLTAKRYDASFARAGQRIVSTAKWLGELEIILKAQDNAAAEMEEEIKALIEQLTKILASQQNLRESVKSAENKHKDTASPEIVTLTKQFSSEQSAIFTESQAAKAKMKELHGKLVIPIPNKEIESIMTQPMKYMDQVISIQTNLVSSLKERGQWTSSRTQQSSSEKLLQKIIEMLSGGAQQSSDEESEESEDETDVEYEYSEEESESSMSSEAMQGDFSSSSQMQALPVPNYSAEDILQEEQSNLQFRQQKRASQNAGKVEKDY